MGTEEEGLSEGGNMGYGHGTGSFPVAVKYFWPCGPPTTPMEAVTQDTESWEEELRG